MKWLLTVTTSVLLYSIVLLAATSAQTMNTWLIYLAWLAGYVPVTIYALTKKQKT